MSRLDEIITYAQECIDHPEVNGRKHIWACMRLLRDVQRMNEDPAYPYEWNEDSADSIVEWFSLLRHSKGVLAGQPINLTEWQRFRLCQLYGWRRKDNGRRRF